jgi:hypothetical protein
MSELPAQQQLARLSASSSTPSTTRSNRAAATRGCSSRRGAASSSRRRPRTRVALCARAAAGGGDDKGADGGGGGGGGGGPGGFFSKLFRVGLWECRYVCLTCHACVSRIPWRQQTASHAGDSRERESARLVSTHCTASNAICRFPSLCFAFKCNVYEYRYVEGELGVDAGAVGRCTLESKVDP